MKNFPGAMLLGAVFLSTGASATPVLWRLSGLTFNDGGKLTGSFLYDADVPGMVSYSLTASGGDTATFPQVTYTEGNSLFDPEPYGFRFWDLNGTTREVRFSPLSALTNAGGTIVLQNEPHAAECFNCVPVRIYATLGWITTAVPEPASWAMLISGFGVIGGALRRRQRIAVRFA